MSRMSSLLRLVLLVALAPLAAPALAQQASQDAAALAEVIARLERRVASLEADAKAAREEARQLRSERAALQARPPRSAAPGPARLLPVADAPEPVYVLPPPRPSWSGFYVGASAGGVRNELDYWESSVAQSASSSTLTTTTFPPPRFLPTTVTLRSATVTDSSSFGRGSLRNHYGALAGVHGGLNWQFHPRFVVGIQAEAGVLNVSDEFRLTGFSNFNQTFTPFFGTQTVTNVASPGVANRKIAQPRMIATLALRAGALVTDHLLLYGLGGWTQIGLDKFSAPGGFTGGGSVNNTEVTRESRSSIGGPTGGVGAELKLDQNWSVFSEYRYARMLPIAADASRAGSGAGAAAVNSTANSAALGQAKLAGDLHFLRFGFSRSFH